MKHLARHLAPTESPCDVDEHARRAPKPVTTGEDAFERAAALFRVVADAARLKLLERLSEGEWCVTELAEAAGSGLSTVSQQLRLLRSERIVTRRRAGKHIFYSLADARVRDLIRSSLAHAMEHPASPESEEDDTQLKETSQRDQEDRDECPNAARLRHA